MNEVTHVHLGRQPFTISVEAHRTLKKYLGEIQEQVSDKDVANEVELRMSELLMERGVTGEKVILPEDVDFLKQQLGNPSDFSDENAAPAERSADDRIPRHLYRDTDRALIAGVSAGVASYFGLDVVLVRIVFVLLTVFSAGVGILLYAVLWLAVPPAVTASEKLQMQGKSVTLETLKDSVSKADLPGSAQRAGNSILPIINHLFAIAIKLLGIGFIISGVIMISSLIAIKTYQLLHHGQFFQENLFPVGTREQWLVIVIMALLAVAAVFLILIGVASFKRKWPIKSWATGLLAGLFLVSLAPALALTADVAPQVRDRYEETLHTTAVKSIQPFDKITTTGAIDITYIPSPTYAVDLHYSGQPNLSKIKINIKDKTLYVDSTAFDSSKNCTMFCLFPRYNMTVEIFAPNISNFDTPSHTDKFYPGQPPLPGID